MRTRISSFIVFPCMSLSNQQTIKSPCMKAYISQLVNRENASNENLAKNFTSGLTFEIPA